jgi:ferredoxin
VQAVTRARRWLRGAYDSALRAEADRRPPIVSAQSGPPSIAPKLNPGLIPIREERFAHLQGCRPFGNCEDRCPTEVERRRRADRPIDGRSPIEQAQSELQQQEFARADSRYAGRADRCLHCGRPNEVCELTPCETVSAQDDPVADRGVEVQVLVDVRRQLAYVRQVRGGEADWRRLYPGLAALLDDHHA